MVVRLNSGGVEGVDAYPVELEVDFVRQGLPGFTMVGLAETAVREARTGFLRPCVPAASSCRQPALQLILHPRGGVKAGPATICLWPWGYWRRRASYLPSPYRACILRASCRSMAHCAR